MTFKKEIKYLCKFFNVYVIYNSEMILFWKKHTCIHWSSETRSMNYALMIWQSPIQDLHILSNIKLLKCATSLKGKYLSTHEDSRANENSSCLCSYSGMSLVITITERLEAASGSCLVPPFLKQGHPEQVAQNHTMQLLKICKERDSTDSVHPVPGLYHPHSKEVLPAV